MVNHMKTTLVIEDRVMRALKAEAARQGRTMSDLVESALRLFLHGRGDASDALPPLPTFRSRALVDVANRDSLESVLRGE